MKSAEEHYTRHLVPIYLWMVGGAGTALAAADAELEALDLPIEPGDQVLDLGAGFGAHAISLARRGAHVTAVDSSVDLLMTLSTLRGALPIQIVHDDLLHFLHQCSQPVSAIVCMGDTITHLPDTQSVNDLLHHAQRLLKPGGTLVVTFRDYTTELLGERRFIQVKADEARILTCFLEYDAASVLVHDILYERMDFEWQTRVSAYRKLRLAPAELLAQLDASGFSARQEAGARGMVRLVATKR